VFSRRGKCQEHGYRYLEADEIEDEQENITKNIQENDPLIDPDEMTKTYNGVKLHIQVPRQFR